MSNDHFNQGRQVGFTTIELVVAFAIVFILVSVAVVSFQDHMARKARAQAHAALLEMAAGLRFQHARTGSFVMDALPMTQVPMDGDAVYRISLSRAEVRADDPKVVFPASSDQAFTLKAEPVEANDCGTLLLDHDGRFGVVGAGAKLADCWTR